LFTGLFGGSGSGFDPKILEAAMGGIEPFAAGGVIGTPTYFPLSSGGLGLAGEAGPEAIMPLARGRDGRLGVAMSGAGATNVTVNISTPDADSFRRSENYLTGQIARAVARGQRSL
jgi:phage-related minor tail protein